MTTTTRTSTGARLHRYLRPHGDGAAEVQPVELFYDVVYVLAVTQLTHHLVAHLTWRGALETLILLLAVWAAWNHIAWVTNYFDLGARATRLVLVGLMLASLVMSSAVNEAFGSHGLAFAGALSASLLGCQSFAVSAVPRSSPLHAVFERVLIWWLPVCALLIAGGLSDGDWRVALWVAGLRSSTGPPGPGSRSRVWAVGDDRLHDRRRAPRSPHPAVRHDRVR